MKKNRVSAILAIVLCMALILPSCKLHKKEPTKKTKPTTEATEPRVTGTSLSLDVVSLNQFISDGNAFEETYTLPVTPSPIPVSPTLLGLTNEDDGYYSGPLENATIVDNAFFRYTILSTEVTSESYIITGEFENKTDVPYNLYFYNPIIDNTCNSFCYYTDVIEPHTVVPDVTDFTKIIPSYDGTEPDRIAFLIMGSALDKSQHVQLFDEEKGMNYVPVMLYPHGEESFVFQDVSALDGSVIGYDSEQFQFAIEYFTIENDVFQVHYSFLNKTSEYMELLLQDHKLMLDDEFFSTYNQANSNYRGNSFIAPYSRQTGAFAVSVEDIQQAGMDPEQVRLASMPLQVYTLYTDLTMIFDATIREQVNMG